MRMNAPIIIDSTLITSPIRFLIQKKKKHTDPSKNIELAKTRNAKTTWKKIQMRNNDFKKLIIWKQHT